VELSQALESFLLFNTRRIINIILMCQCASRHCYVQYLSNIEYNKRYFFIDFEISWLNDFYNDEIKVVGLVFLGMFFQIIHAPHSVIGPNNKKQIERKMKDAPASPAANQPI